MDLWCLAGKAYASWTWIPMQMTVGLPGIEIFEWFLSFYLPFLPLDQSFKVPSGFCRFISFFFFDSLSFLSCFSCLLGIWICYSLTKDLSLLWNPRRISKEIKQKLMSGIPKICCLEWKEFLQTWPCIHSFPSLLEVKSVLVLQQSFSTSQRKLRL